MWKSPILLVALGAAVLLSACESAGKKTTSRARTKATLRNVRTTAYTHTESDHIQYGKRNALGLQLNETGVRSAAADWSVYPVGTTFRIKGQPSLYMVDDYGSALVGSNTIDIYQPSKQDMRQWGVRNVDIDVVNWGSPQESLRILEPRTRWSHVRQMVTRLKRSGAASSRPARTEGTRFADG